MFRRGAVPYNTIGYQPGWAPPHDDYDRSQRAMIDYYNKLTLPGDSVHIRRFRYPDLHYTGEHDEYGNPRTVPVEGPPELIKPDNLHAHINKYAGRNRGYSSGPVFKDRDGDLVALEEQTFEFPVQDHIVMTEKRADHLLNDPAMQRRQQQIESPVSTKDQDYGTAQVSGALRIAGLRERHDRALLEGDADAAVNSYSELQQATVGFATAMLQKPRLPPGATSLGFGRSVGFIA